MNPPLWLVLLSMMFVGTSISIVIKQQQAKSCPMHRRYVGYIAQALAITCLVVGIVLAGLALAGRNL